MSIQVFDEAAVVSILNRAFNDVSPANAIFQNQVASAKASAPTYAAFANAFGASFSGVSNAALSKQVLTNMGVLPTTDTSVAALEQALTDYFAAYGSKTVGANGQVAADTRGFIVLQLANILAGLETVTGTQAVYNKAAIAWNTEVASAYTYSSNPANTTPTTPGAPTVGQTYTLTAGADTITGTAANDIFNGPAVVSGSSTIESLTAFDNLDGGDGTDTLNASLPTTTLTGVAGGMTIKNIENVVLNATGVASTNIIVDPGASFPGATNFTLNNANGGASVTSGTNVTVSSGNSTAQVVSVTGAALTNVTVKGGTPTINNNSATGTTLTAVTLESIGGTAAISGNAVTTVTWKNQTTAQAVGITNATSTSLTLNVDGVGYDGSGTTIATKLTPGAAVTSLTINATGTKSNPTIVNSTATIKTLTLTGSAELNLASGAISSTPTSVTKVDGSAATGVIKLDASALTSATTISTGAGADTVTAGATTSGTISLGAGNDKLLGTAVLTTPGVIDGGDGTDSVAIALLQNVASSSLGQFKNFEAIDIGSGGASTVDISTLSGSTITALTQSTALSGGAVSGLAANTGLTITNQITTVATGTQTNGLNAAPTGAATLALANASGASDAMTITFAGTGSDAAKQTTDGGTLTINGIENVTIASGGTATNNTIALVDNALQTLTITGSTPLYLTQLASTNGAAVGTSDTINGVKLIDGSAATGKLYLDASALTNIAKAGMTIKGGTGADTIVGTSKADVIVGGGGADVVTGGLGADKITITGATSTVKVVASADTGANNATATQTALLTGGLDIVTGAVAGTKISIDTTVGAAAANKYASVGAVADSAFVAPTTTLSTNLQGVNNSAVFVRGTYDAANGIFNYGASGPDSALTYDFDAANATQDYHTIILVGYVPSTSTAAAASAATNVATITLA